jgi:hypothetical protein
LEISQSLGRFVFLLEFGHRRSATDRDDNTIVHRVKILVLRAFLALLIGQFILIFDIRARLSHFGLSQSKDVKYLLQADIQNQG